MNNTKTSLLVASAFVGGVAVAAVTIGSLIAGIVLGVKATESIKEETVPQDLIEAM